MVAKSKVLIVDDNINMFKTLAFILRRKGHDVFTASSGLEALELVKQKNFDIIFLDIKMSEMNGVEVFKRIMQINSKITVILMTAYSVDDLIQEALREGARGVIYKPLNIDKVQEIINECMENMNAGLILVVDDDSSFTKTMKNILTKHNFIVGIAETGEKAITLTKKNNYDIIFIEMKLPKINGLETYLAIKKIKPKATVIMITALHNEMDVLIEEALKESAFACLKKPLDMVSTLSLIDEIWKKKQEDVKMAV